MNDRNFVRLRILSSTHTPEALTRHIGVECERSWRVGDKRGKTHILEPMNGWLLSSGLIETASLDEHIQKLLERIIPLADRIATLPGETTVEISCAIYAESPPALSFSSSIVEQMAKLRASLDVDLYIMEEAVTCD